ncbi:MAG: S8 family serine peptidase, partial [Chloroflexi bacterium]|nr:S8 family serine peptidase [Chloroflexota bacterium]
PTPGLETYKFQPVEKIKPTEAELAWIAEVQKVDGFIVQLDEPSLATYNGGINGFSVPNRTDSGKIDVNSDSSIAYTKHLRQQIDNAIISSEKIVGRDLDVYARFEVVLNGFAAKMTAQEAAALRDMPGVREVYPDLVWYPDTDTSPEFLGVDGIWDGTNVADGVTAKGEGVLVGILDTGINMDHPSFAEVGPVDGYVHTNPFGADVFKGLCASDPDNYVCNNKLVGVYAYTTEPIRGEDSEDHGTHTASTTAGNVVELDFGGSPVTISGMAPHANIIAFDVCTADGCANAATVSAVEQAISDGVDVLNYSIGPNSGPGQSPYASATEVAFLEAVDAGIITATSAGNSGPAVSTTYKAAPWTLIVANTNHGRIFGNPVIVNPGDATEYSAIGLPDAGPALLADLTNVPLKWGGLDAAANDLACTALPVDYFTDTVALVTRGTCSFDVKITNAQNAGALAVIVRNNAPGAPIVMGLNEDPPTTVTIPAVMVSKDDGDAIVALADAGTTVTLEANYGSQNEPEWGDVLNSSSSRGPFTLADVLVPEIAAPGTNVLAAYDSQGPSTEYGLMSGTSMASPHAAGSLALLTELFPTWSPAARKSALMLTALAGTTKDSDFGPVDAFDYGNGRLDMSKAALTGLVMDETYEGFVAADPAEGGDITTVNIPSYQNTFCVGVCSFERTFKSVADVAVTYTLDLAADVDLVVDVQPATFTIQPGGTQTITVEIDSDAAESEVWVFGRIGYTTTDTWSTGEEISNVALPFAVRPYPSNMPEYVEKDILRDQGATVVTEVQSKAISEFTAVKSGLVPGTDTELTVLPDATNGDPFDDLSQVWWKTFTLSEDADRLVMEILDTTAGDLDMFFGIGTVPDPDMVVADSATATALEYISITGIPAGLPLWVLVQNWEGNSSGDLVKYTEAVIYPEDAENWDVTGPASVEALEPYDVTISWNIPDMPTPSAWYGMFDILASPESTDPISTTEFNLYRTGDDVVKSVNKDSARKDDVVTYEIQINPNFSDTDLTYTIEDTLPVEVEYVDGSLEVIGSETLATYDAATRTVSWVGVSPSAEFNYIMSDNLTDPNCVMP